MGKKENRRGQENVGGAGEKQAAARKELKVPAHRQINKQTNRTAELPGDGISRITSLQRPYPLISTGSLHQMASPEETVTHESASLL